MFFSFITFLCFFLTYLKPICIPLKSEKIDVIVVKTRDLLSWNSIFNPFCEGHKCLSPLVMGRFMWKIYLIFWIYEWIFFNILFSTFILWPHRWYITSVMFLIFSWTHFEYLSNIDFIIYRVNNRVIENHNNSHHHSC